MKLSGLLALLGLTATAHAQVNGDYEITGQDQLLAGQTVYLLAPVRPSHSQRWPVLDSARADASGHFALRGQVPTPDVYLLRVGPQGTLQQVPLANRQERITTRVKPVRMGSSPEPVYQLLPSGTSETALLEEFVPFTTLRVIKVAGTDKTLRQFEAQLRQHLDSYVAPYLAYSYLRAQTEALPLVDSLARRFGREQPASPYLPRLRALLGAGQTLSVGAVAPDFTLAGTDGKLLTLSGLRGRYVLLDFWASWCKPCRAETPNVLAAYQKYQAQGAGFTVLSVSLDEKAADWQRAVQQDALPWAQVADLAGFQGQVSKLYNVSAIPFTLLLDPQGRIVATDLRGPALGKELARVLR